MSDQNKLKMRIAPTYLTLFFLFLCLSITSYTQAATISGIVKDQTMKLPYVNVYLEGTTIGTTTNEQGVFILKINEGNHNLVFQYLGYQKKTLPIQVGSEDQYLEIELTPESYQLNEIVVSSDAEDPAYPIIRKAIKKRKFYLQQIENYTCQVYTKGVQKFKDLPEKFLGQELNIPGLDSTRSGIAYLSESVAELYYKKPNQIKEKVISSKVSGDDRGFSFNRASDMVEINFYQNNIPMPISPRGYISPIAQSALTYYKYKLEGSFQDGEHLIHKIKVTPKRAFDPVFEGHIYVQEEAWRLHSIDLTLGANQMEIVKSLRIQQTYVPATTDIWVLLSQRFDFILKFLAFNINGNFSAIYSDYDLNPSFDAKFFRKEAVKVTEDSNKRDSLYWENIRPIKLTEEELVDYHKKDSISIVIESKEYKDSLDQVNNKIKLGDLLLSGYAYRNRYRNYALFFSPLISNFQYNTVEGLNFNLGIQFQKRLDENRRKWLQVKSNLRYGFSNKHFNPNLQIRFMQDRKYRSWIELAGGKAVYQLNPKAPISSIINTSYTLFAEHNYMKIYEAAFAKITYHRELWNGVMGKIRLNYEDRIPLENTTDYTFFNKEERQFTPNYPNQINNNFTQHQALILDINLKISFRQKYFDYPHFKIRMDSKWPQLGIQYRKGFKDLLGSDVNFDYLKVSLKQRIGFKLFGYTSYDLSASTFLNKKSVSFIDQHHFSGNQTIFASNYLEQFQLLPYYDQSTTDAVLEAHLEHHFSGFITNKLPLLRKLKWYMVAGANAFYIDKNRNHYELIIGLENILKTIRLNYVQNLKNWDERGFRMSIPIVE